MLTSKSCRRCARASRSRTLRTACSAKRAKLDKAVFGVAGALALAFVVWGFAGRESLAAVSQTALDWVMKDTGWLFIALASLFVVYVLWLALGRFGNIPLGKDGEKPEFRTVSWISMMFACRHGHRPHVLRRRRAPVPLHLAAAGHRRRPDLRGHPDGHGHLALPLDPPPLGHVRRGRHGHGLRNLPAGPAAADLRSLHLPFRRQVGGRNGRAVHQHARHLRHPLRNGRLAGARGAADRQRPGRSTGGSADSSPRRCWWGSSPS